MSTGHAEHQEEEEPTVNPGFVKTSESETMADEQADVSAAVEQHIKDKFKAMFGLLHNIRTETQRAVDKEKERKEQLQKRTDELDQEIKSLRPEGVPLLKDRLLELGITEPTPRNLMEHMRKAIDKQKQLQNSKSKLELEILSLEMKRKGLVQQYLERVPEYKKHFGESTINTGSGENFDELACELKEISQTLNARRNIETHINLLEMEHSEWQRAAKERSAEEVFVASETTNNVPDNHEQSTSNATSLPPSISQIEELREEALTLWEPPAGRVTDQTSEAQTSLKSLKEEVDNCMEQDEATTVISDNET